MGKKHIKDCKHKNLKPKENHTVTIRLGNNKKTMFEAPASKCKECGELIFHECDADNIFDAFDKAVNGGKSENGK